MIIHKQFLTKWEKKIIRLFINVRVSVEEENQGLDKTLHGETGYDL